MNDAVEVLIIGAGASGLTLACDLQRRGVKYRIIEASDHGFLGSRAKGVQPRTLEVFDDLGALPGVVANSTLYPPLGVHLGPFTVPRTMIKHHKSTPDVPHSNTLLVPQSATDRSLRERLEALGGSVEYSTRLVSCGQDENGATASITGPEGPATIQARYLVGADGGSSTVRRSAGIAFAGTTDPSDRMIVADVTLTGLSRGRWHIWPHTGGRFLALCPLPDGSFQLMVKLRPDDPVSLDLASIENLVHRFAGRSRVQLQEVLWSSIWRPNIRLAERYRVERIFLVGDAAHVHPPTGGQGLNIGVQDAYNLGWKLAQVLSGAPPELLDSYEAERQPVAARVLGLSTALYGHLKDRPLVATSRGDEERQLTLSYRGGPLTTPNETSNSHHIEAGDRAPDSPIRTHNGARSTLFDHFRGPHFTLVAIGEIATQAANSIPWPDSGARVHRVMLDTARNEDFRRLYGIDATADAFVLARPDGYVAAIGEHPTLTGVAALLPTS